MDSRTNARPTPSTRPAAKARTPLRSGLGLEGTLGGCAASPMVRPPLTSGLRTSSWERRSTRAVPRDAVGARTSSICSSSRTIASSSDFCSVFCLQVTNAAAAALARAAAPSGSGRTAVMLMMSVLGSASAETSAISVAGWSFQPSSSLGGRQDLRSHRDAGQGLQLALVGLGEVDRRAHRDADGGGLRLGHDPCGRGVQRRLQQADEHHDGGDDDDRLDDQPLAAPEDLGVGAQARCRLALIGQGGRLSLVAGSVRQSISQGFRRLGRRRASRHQTVYPHWREEV